MDWAIITNNPPKLGDGIVLQTNNPGGHIQHLILEFMVLCNEGILFCFALLHG